VLPLSQTSNLLYFDEYCNHLFEISQVPGKMCMYSFCRVASTDMLTVFYPQIRASVSHRCLFTPSVFIGYSPCPPTEGWLRLSWPGCLFLCRGGTKQAYWHRITTGTLIETNTLPLCQIDTNTNTQQLWLGVYFEHKHHITYAPTDNSNVSNTTHNTPRIEMPH